MSKEEYCLLRDWYLSELISNLVRIWHDIFLYLAGERNRAKFSYDPQLRYNTLCLKIASSSCMGWLFTICYQPVKTQVYLFIYRILAGKKHHSEEAELWTNTWSQGLLSFKT